jgi:hypothetical protein
MKAKELAERFINADDKETELHEIIKGISVEVDTLRKARNIKVDTGLIGIFKDLDKKYQTFAMIVNSHYNHNAIKPYFFRIWLKTVYPGAYDYYLASVG